MKKDQTITFVTTAETKNKLLQWAKKEDRTLSYIINKIVTERLLSGSEGSEMKDCAPER